MCRLFYTFMGSAHCKAWLKIQILNQRRRKLQKSLLRTTKAFTNFPSWILQPNVGGARRYKILTRGKRVTKRYPTIIANIIKAFREQLLKKIPTGEAAVERVFSRRKLVRSPLWNCFKSDNVNKKRFVRCYIAFLYPGLPFSHFECKNEDSGFGVLFE